jgi:hypothetical protein
MTDVTEHDLLAGYPIAYVAQAARSRRDGLGDRMLDRLTARSVEREVRAIDAVMVADGVTTEEQLARDRSEEAARLARDYPDGEPFDAELDAWCLVRGLARRLGGTCRLADGRFFVPVLSGEEDLLLYARTLLDADEVIALLSPILGDLVLDPGESDDEWTISRSSGRTEVSVVASVWDRDPDLRVQGIEPLAAYDGIGGLTVEYAFAAPDDLQAQLLEACALLAPYVEGVVIDAEGFPTHLHG